MTNTDTKTPRQIAELYFDCWSRKDFTELRALLAPDARFDGVFGTAEGPDELLAGLSGMAAGTRDLVVRKRLADESDVITWFDLAMGDAPATPVANWTHVVDGLVRQIRVTFDPREIIADGR